MTQEASSKLSALLADLESAFSEHLAGSGDRLSRPINDLLCDIAMQGVRCGDEKLRQTALTLLSFHENRSTEPLAAGDREQVALLLDSLRRRVLGEQATAANLPRLIATVTPSGPSSNRAVCLLVESRAIAAMLAAALRAAGYEPAVISSMKQLLDVAAEQAPAAVVADLSVCRDDPDTRACIERFRGGPFPPVHLFCLSTGDDTVARLEAVRLGATRFLKKPVDIAKLVAILDGVTSRHTADAFRVLLVDDDRALTALYAGILGAAGLETRFCNDPLAAVDAVAAFAPDVIVTDVYMPGCNGFELAALLRQDEALADTPILFLSSETDIKRQMAALDLGADDFLTKPVNLEVLAAAVVARAKRARMLKRIRRELTEARAEAERANHAKSSFLANINHELRTPLNSILGHAQLMESDLAPDSETRDSLQAILGAGRHLLDLINEILDLARIEAGHLSLTPDVVDAAELANVCAHLVAPLAQARHIDIAVAVPAACRVRADRKRMQQVMLNLLSNAVKYNRDGGSVRVAAAGDGRSWRFAVVDSGYGIRPESLDELFKPFSRLNAAQEGIEGAGLGLALSKRLVEAMSGAIGVSSTPGEGSEFWFTLPAAG
ncbi:MAG: response regulator [Rhodocyclales bacterium]|nr:response regulator [Rhodocyclales bacterium]